MNENIELCHDRVPGKAWMSQPPDEQGTVQCMACSFFCKVPKGRLGRCNVRFNNDGNFELLVYSKIVAENIDPIEKKPLYHFYPGKGIYSIGTMGCNFRCSFCQNWSIAHVLNDADLRQEQFRTANIVDIEECDFGSHKSPEEVVRRALRTDCSMVATTYNEPTIFFEYMYDIFRLAKERDLKTVMVTNGFISEIALRTLNPYLDAMNIDLKAYTESFYRKTCGAHLEPVKETIRLAYELGIHVEITTLLIEGQNSTSEEIEELVKFLAGISQEIPWHISAAHPDYKQKDMKSTTMNTIQNAFAIGQKYGLKFIYIGNILSENGTDTFCPNCGKRVINRNCYRVLKQCLNEDHCPDCDYKIYGCF
eukprot:TRINITY_DN1642_c1_g1_i1.p1 TRINITY_DN1642_c1_g1~~TRINITY_DN1642_c1_g1_i1.p1  ORF type:complete len:365 (+),score=77.65 TRINITY_DN1642_c1_g1_i1:128-1222(+)